MKQRVKFGSAQIIGFVRTASGGYYAQDISECSNARDALNELRRGASDNGISADQIISVEFEDEANHITQTIL